jgi:NhaA family Na+:H+ antiporter
LRLFLLTLAVVDDIGAITVLASYYTNTLHATAVAMTLVLLACLVALRWLGVWRLLPYVLVGLALWLAVYKSGVHPTLAGVLVGLVIPARPVREEHVLRLGVYGRALIEEPSAKRARLAILAATATVPPNERLQRVLHPWSAYLVVPAFGIANAGVQLSGGVVRNAVSSPITIGIVVALVVGKLVGITLGSTLALRTHLGELPGLVRYSHLVGGATLAGMGFTISLFVTDIAFSTQTLRDEARIGILAGSLSAALLGTWILRVMGERSPLCSPASALTPPALPPLPWTATADT